MKKFLFMVAVTLFSQQFTAPPGYRAALNNMARIIRLCDRRQETVETIWRLVQEKTFKDGDPASEAVRNQYNQLNSEIAGLSDSDYCRYFVGMGIRRMSIPSKNFYRLEFPIVKARNPRGCQRYI